MESLRTAGKFNLLYPELTLRGGTPFRRRGVSEREVGKSEGRLYTVDRLSETVVRYATPIIPADTPAMRNGVSLLSA